LWQQPGWGVSIYSHGFTQQHVHQHSKHKTLLGIDILALKQAAHLNQMLSYLVTFMYRVSIEHPLAIKIF